jgi:hypothetical protein
MAFRRVFLILLPCQAAMGRIQYSSICCQMCVGSCGYVPSCQAPVVATSRDPWSAMLIHLQETTGCVPLGTQAPSPSQRERLEGLSGDEILDARANHMVEK